MFRVASLAAVLAFGPTCVARADTVYYCVPDEQRVTAPDRLISVEVTLKPTGEFASVVYKAANGAAYSRGQQYEATNSLDANGEHYWTGTLHANPNVTMIGTLSRKGDSLLYFETIHDKQQGGKIVSHVASICNIERPTAVEASPPQAPTAAPSPPVSFSKREFDAFADCIHTAALALSLVSNEPAQTIVDAALGECPRERIALVNALQHQGVTRPVDFLDGLIQELRPDLLAGVLNTRAAAARPGPTKSEPAKGEPL